MKYFLLPLAALLTCKVTAQPSWQQRVDSKIEVTLNDKEHFLYAHEELSYTNNSPDTLRYIYMHLWPNAYKNDRTPFARQQDVNNSTAFYYSKPADRGYIDSIQFMVDGQAVDHYSTEATPDIARLDLPRPLPPGNTIKITTPFRVKIPKVFSRMGHTGQAYYISQWFPKPAVYDQKGWHPIPYLDQGEFFSEYGAYDVSITLPSNYVVMATGNCLDQKENDWMDELAKLPLPETRYRPRSPHRDTTPPSATDMKTIHFHEDNVHDFAWFADKRWLVRKDTVYSPGNGQLVTTWAAFMPSYWQTWAKASTYLKETVRHYGKWIGPYRYKTIKAVLGDLRAGGGMEYPTVTVIDRQSSSQLKTVIIHEAGHNWFYGMLGSNERDHAWMDEGINTFYEQKTTADLESDSLSVKNKKRKFDETMVYFERAVTGDDQAIDQASANFEKLNYGLDVYYKTAMCLRWLEKYMGQSDFEAGMHDYYDTWHFHHPYPADIKACLQRHTTKSIDWFFDPILQTSKPIDFKITKYSTDGTNTTITVRNRSGVYSPVMVNAYSGHDSLVSSAMSQPFTRDTTVTLPGTSWSRLSIDDIIPDAKPTNDVFRRHAIFHRFGLQLKPLAGLNVSDKDKLFISPALGYNDYDGIMAGIVLHDLTLPENRFRFALAPLYSFASQSLVGCGSIGYAWYPGNIFKEVLVQADGKMFHYNEMLQPSDEKHIYTGYTKVAPSLNFTFNEHDATSPVTRTLTLKAYSISEEYFDSSSIPATGSLQVRTIPVNSAVNYGLLRYRHRNNRAYNPFSYSLEGQMGEDFAKVSAEGNIRIDYDTRKKSLRVRAFLGKFFPITNTASVISRYELNASYSGADDYLYDGTYMGRNAQDKIPAQQVSMQEGGFKVPIHNGAARSDNWMAALNLSTDLPRIKLPVRLFLDAGLIPNATPTFKHSGSTTLLYDGGVEISLLSNVVSVYIPIIMSSEFQNYLTAAYGNKNVFGRSISFTLQLQNINWLKAPSRALKMVTN